MNILENGTKVLIAHRRLFVGDHGRYFVGVVEAYDSGIVRVDGYTWLRDGYDGTFRRKTDRRTKIVPINSGTVIVYQIPMTVDVSSFHIDNEATKTIARDGKGFEMDLSEGILHGGSDARASHQHVA